MAFLADSSRDPIMRAYDLESLSHDPIHGYIPFSSRGPGQQDVATERDLIDHPWVQRMRHIHQLQTAWWVYPSAEHTRFQHVIGVMHLASRMAAATFDSLKAICTDLPSLAYVESLLRISGLLHDVGHGPFGHFFDEHFLRHHGLTHETLGAQIIREELGDLIRGIRRNPNGVLADNEQLNPAEIAWLICRPAAEPQSEKLLLDDGASAEIPHWLRLLRNLFSGIYTIDNMDFVLRDAYMSGYSQRAYDLDRLLHYSFFTDQGLTIHDRGIEALMRFMSVRAELFRSIYFHRTVRAIDLTLADLFPPSRDWLFAGNPAEDLAGYRAFTESSLLVDVQRWTSSEDVQQRQLGEQWQALMRHQIPWKMVCQRTISFLAEDSEQSSIFSDSAFVEQKIREQLPQASQGLAIKVDIARHIHRPHTSGPSGGQNFLYDSARDLVRPLTTHELFDRLPVSQRICRIYAQSNDQSSLLAHALDQLMGGGHADDLTNM